MHFEVEIMVLFGLMYVYVSKSTLIDPDLYIYPPTIYIPKVNQNICCNNVEAIHFIWMWIWLTDSFYYKPDVEDTNPWKAEVKLWSESGGTSFPVVYECRITSIHEIWEVERYITQNAVWRLKNYVNMLKWS